MCEHKSCLEMTTSLTSYLYYVVWVPVCQALYWHIEKSDPCPKSLQYKDKTQLVGETSQQGGRMKLQLYKHVVHKL